MNLLKSSNEWNYPACGEISLYQTVNPLRQQQDTCVLSLEGRVPHLNLLSKSKKKNLKWISWLALGRFSLNEVISQNRYEVWIYCISLYAMWIAKAGLSLRTRYWNASKMVPLTLRAYGDPTRRTLILAVTSINETGDVRVHKILILQ